MKKVILFTDQFSYFGAKVRQWLKDSGIEFVEKDVAKPENLAELGSVSGQYAIPVVVIGEKVVLGFDEKELKKLLK